MKERKENLCYPSQFSLTFPLTPSFFCSLLFLSPIIRGVSLEAVPEPVPNRFQTFTGSAVPVPNRFRTFAGSTVPVPNRFRNFTGSTVPLPEPVPEPPGSGTGTGTFPSLPISELKSPQIKTYIIKFLVKN